MLVRAIVLSCVLQISILYYLCVPMFRTRLITFKLCNTTQYLVLSLSTSVLVRLMEYILCTTTKYSVLIEYLSVGTYNCVKLCTTTQYSVLFLCTAQLVHLIVLSCVLQHSIMYCLCVPQC